MRNPGTVSPSRTNDPNVQDRCGICTPSLQELAKTAHQVDSHVRNINSETTNYHHAESHGRREFSTDNGTDLQHRYPIRCIRLGWGQFVKGKGLEVTGA